MYEDEEERQHIQTADQPFPRFGEWHDKPEMPGRPGYEPQYGEEYNE